MSKRMLASEILRLRLAQMLVNEWYRDGRFKIPIHLAMGHEAIAVAVAHCLATSDQLILSHRNLHYNLALANPFGAIIREYLLQADGLAGGRLGSMNLADGQRIIYTSSILGNNMGVAAGAALAQKVNGTGGVLFAQTGDGAIEEGAFYESLLFAKTHELAIVYVVENNGWSLATTISERRHEIDLLQLTGALSMPYYHLAGNDVFAYAGQLAEIRTRALAQRTPVCLEVQLSSLGGWMIHDEQTPEGRYANYHAGPAPEIEVKPWPLVEASADDPVHVLLDYFDRAELQALAASLLNDLRDDLPCGM